MIFIIKTFNIITHSRANCKCFIKFFKDGSHFVQAALFKCILLVADDEIHHAERELHGDTEARFAELHLGAFEHFLRAHCKLYAVLV